MLMKTYHAIEGIDKKCEEEVKQLDSFWTLKDWDCQHSRYLENASASGLAQASKLAHAAQRNPSR